MEGLPGITVNQLDGEAFEGMSLGNCTAYRLLELLVPSGHAHTSFQLVGGQGRGEEVAEVIVPHRSQTQILGGGALCGSQCWTLPIP